MIENAIREMGSDSSEADIQKALVQLVSACTRNGEYAGGLKYAEIVIRMPGGKLTNFDLFRAYAGAGSCAKNLTKPCLACEYLKKSQKIYQSIQKRKQKQLSGYLPYIRADVENQCGACP